MVGPVIDEISAEPEGKAVVGKVDVDANQRFAAKYGVRNIPTVLVFQNGEVVGRQVGVALKNLYWCNWCITIVNIIKINRKVQRKLNLFL